jgi:hypothetical protein
VWHRSKHQARTILIVNSTLIALTLLVVIGGATSSENDLPAAETVAVLVASGGIAAAGLLFTRRLAGAGIYTDENELTVLNPFRSYDLTWRDIVEFGFDRNAYGAGRGAAFVRLRSGAQIRIWGIQSRAGSFRGEELLVTELNRLLHDRRPDHRDG